LKHFRQKEQGKKSKPDSPTPSAQDSDSAETSFNLFIALYLWGQYLWGQIFILDLTGIVV
jgi:hypothetical protein